MPNTQTQSAEKRVYALLELFSSEEEYIKDMRIWTRTVKYTAGNTRNLSEYDSQLFIKNILINSEEIVRVHEKIYWEIRKIIDLSDKKNNELILQKNISEDQMKRICACFSEKKENLLKMYAVYTSSLPQAISGVEKLLRENRNFEHELMNLLQKMDRTGLECKHFITRPTTKMLRYPLLFKAIEKRALPDEKDALQEAISAIQYISKKLDEKSGYSTNYFNLYNLVHTTEFKTKTSFLSAGILQKERNLIRIDEDISILINKRRNIATLVLLDNCFFFVESIQRSDIPTISAPGKKILGDYVPISTLAIERVFNNEKDTVLLRLKAENESIYEIEGVDVLLDAIYENIKNMQNIEKKNYLNVRTEEADITLPGKNIFLSIISSTHSNELHLNKLGTLVAGTSTGLFLIMEKETKRIDDRSIQNIVYNPDVSSIFFQIDEKNIYYLNYPIDNKKIKKLYSTFSKFFLQTTQLSELSTQEKDLVLSFKKKGIMSSEQMLIYKLKKENDEILSILYKTMYMVGEFNGIFFFKNHIVIASNDFELIDLNDLTTQDLLDPLDQTINLYLDKAISLPLLIIKIEKNLYLTLFSNLGFFINQYGSRVKKEVLFLWFMETISVHLYKDYVVAIGKKYVKFFSVSTGMCKGFLKVSNARFLPHHEDLLLYNDKILYRVFIE
ncbi:hypothetical protein NEFER03_0389 [Nematocida sp. LUAm3]|nr:hypothetical protein NEFER03_0389 [Nematocida sp. LUAm3]KAI5175995.1 hypothetical protein NEFER02_1841 [Nematocida sp. LUAm2]KAI5179091.1 hypothetical protein NEFER01_1958 [Nematocida sp. LUAm1]